MEEALKTRHRVFLTWQAWWELELNHPDRHDYYLMRIALEVARKFVDDPSAYQLDNFRIVFERTMKRPMTEQEELDFEKAKWATALRAQYPEGD